jgi:hypothetical protein
LSRFEVVAVNKEGESPAAKTKDPVSAENPYSAPGEPTDLRITDYDEKSVTLRWAKPRDIGLPRNYVRKFREIFAKLDTESGKVRN